jgi:hypothetical protein
MAENRYMSLNNSAGTSEYKFRVVAEGYDDGTLNRSESLNRAIGGGIDHSLGQVYRTWSPMILVRFTETDSGYGNLSNLEYFYALNNPAGTPSNKLTFTNHHGTSYYVHMVGTMEKQCLGSRIEGTQAWFVYRLTLMEE